MHKKKKRRPLVAAALTLIGGGAGFLYVGKPRLALALALAPILLVAIVAWTGSIFTPAGFYLLAFLLLLLWLGSSVLAAVYARRQGEIPLNWYQRWYIYAIWLLVLSAPTNSVLGNRSALFGYDMFRFTSSSMRETLMPGDFFLSNTRKYRNVSPASGELVVFRYPGDPSVKYVKRIVGLPGDTVALKRGEVWVNGKQLAEPYVSPANNVKTAKTEAQFSVPVDSFFVLGDNRDRSNDSRYWGFVPAENLHGSLEFVWFSYDRTRGIRFDRIGMRAN